MSTFEQQTTSPQSAKPNKCPFLKSDEDEFGERIERCVGDTLLKTAGGFALGLITSFALFKRRAGPIWFGTGIG